MAVGDRHILTVKFFKICCIFGICIIMILEKQRFQIDFAKEDKQNKHM